MTLEALNQVQAMRADCPLCSREALVPCLDQPKSAALQNGMFRSVEGARGGPVGPLAIRACGGCGFVFNAAYGEGVHYDASYENDQSSSPAFSSHVDRMAGRILSALEDRRAPVLVDVGAGQGYFLERIVTKAGERLHAAFGFDPAWRGVQPGAGAKMSSALFDAEAARDLPPIDAVVSRHVIEHIADPVAFLEAIARGLPKGALIFVETPCVQWILDGKVMQDFFFEHCSYFTTDTLAFALSRTGFEVESVEHVFDGQYLWAAARFTGETKEWRPSSESLERVKSAAQTFAVAHQASVERWRRELSAFPPKVAAWGAGAKGVTFVNTVDPDQSRVDCVIDINPRKQGAFVSISAHPILSPRGAYERGVRSLVIMNPNYRAEIERYIASQGLSFELVTTA